MFGRTVRVEGVLDLAPADGPVWRVNDRTQFLETRAALTWTGIRLYRFADGPKRVLRRPEQVMAPGHLATLKRLTATPGHPMHRGRPLNISRDNAARFDAGHTGDAITAEVIKGYTVPVADVTVDRPTTIDAIQGGATGTSLGYTAMIDITGGLWDGPDGPVPFDFEHILDPSDPRVLELVEETRDEEEPFRAESLGGNHFAVALPRLAGRGAELAELMAPIRDSAAMATSLLVQSTPADWFTNDRHNPCRSRVFMHRDAAGIAPEVTPDQGTTMTIEAKPLVRVPFIVDGFTLPPNTVQTYVDVDEETAARMAGMLRMMGEQMSAMADKLTAAEAAMSEAAEGKTAAEGAQAEAATEVAEMQDSLAKAKARIMLLETEVSEAPKRLAELVEVKTTAKRVHDSKEYDALDNAEDVKRLAVAGKTGKPEHNAADVKKASPTVVIDSLWDHFVEQLTDSDDATKGKRERTRADKPRARIDLSKNKTRDADDNVEPSLGTSILDKLNNQARA